MNGKYCSFNDDIHDTELNIPFSGDWDCKQRHRRRHCVWCTQFSQNKCMSMLARELSKESSKEEEEKHWQNIDVTFSADAAVSWLIFAPVRMEVTRQQLVCALKKGIHYQCEHFVSLCKHHRWCLQTWIAAAVAWDSQSSERRQILKLIGKWEHCCWLMDISHINV
jgi:hypothetical protein